MQREVIVDFGAGSEFVLVLPPGAAQPADAARRWLDDEFQANDCEPLRASGKVLVADKVLALAAQVGPPRFRDDAAWAQAFAAAVVAALGKDVVRVDVDGRALTY